MGILSRWRHRRAIRNGRKRYDAKHRYDTLVTAAEAYLQVIEHIQVGLEKVALRRQAANALLLSEMGRVLGLRHA